MPLGQRREKVSRLQKMVLFGSSAQGYDNFVQIGDFPKVLHDALDRRRPQLGRGDGKDKGDGPVTAEFDKLLLYPVQVRGLEPVKSGDDSGLIKISHGNLLIWIVQPAKRPTSSRTATHQPMGPSPGAKMRLSSRMEGSYCPPGFWTRIGKSTFSRRGRSLGLSPRPIVRRSIQPSRAKKSLTTLPALP